MRFVTHMPHKVEVTPHVWIEMPDGCRLSAKTWVPHSARDKPVPAILEYIPYRKRDIKAWRDSTMHGYFAGHGYAAVRVDLRGSGDSQGVLTDEYLQQELDDGVAVIDWIANQPWCDGNVGMMGISWGGFNSLQIAAMQPEALKAIVAVCSTDDRYADDVHYMGGCLLGDNLSWATVMFAYNACPPDPAVVGDAWRDMWMDRLKHSGLWLHTWLTHQHRNSYWKHGSICENYSAMQTPVMLASGWADGYTNAVFRMLEKLEAPRLGLVGPWSHKYPHNGVPGPAIGFLQEALRWWDYWLKGKDTGIMNEPMLRAWMQDSVPPSTQYQKRPGRWVAEREWPSPDIEYRQFALQNGYALTPIRDTAVEEPLQEVPLPDQSPLSVGLFAGKWCSYSAAPDLPGDQREEDGGSLVFESTPLVEPLELIGAPQIELELTSDQPVAMVAARLSDIAEDRKATRVTYGLLNLTHRDSAEHPEPLKPGKRYRVKLDLNYMAHSFPAGHRLRIALSTSYWPLAWAPPKPVRLTIFTGCSRLVIPVRSPKKSLDKKVHFREPRAAAPVNARQVEPSSHSWRVMRDLAINESTLEVIQDSGRVRMDDIDLDFERKAFEWYTYQGARFDSLKGETYWERSFERDGWSVRVTGRTVLTCDENNFYVRAELDAYEGKARVYSHNWKKKIKRRLV